MEKFKYHFPLCLMEIIEDKALFESGNCCSCCMAADVTGSDASAFLFCAFCLCRETTKLQKEATSIESSLEEKRLRRHNLLLECKVQDLKIKILYGSLDDISEIEVLKMFTDITEEQLFSLECKDIYFFLTGLFV